MLKLMEKAAKEEDILSNSGYEPGVRGKHEEGGLQAELGPEERRPGAHKMVLTPEKEAALPLVRCPCHLRTEWQTSNLAQQSMARGACLHVKLSLLTVASLASGTSTSAVMCSCCLSL